MRIGIDGRELLGNRTGVGRYLAELCDRWRRLPRADGHEFVVYSPQPGDYLSDLGWPFEEGREEARGRFSHRSVPGPGGTRWEQTALPAVANADGIDVFFAPAYSAPLRLRSPHVVTIHDVSFVAHPEWFRWRDGVRRRWLTRHAVARAHAVITVSRFSRQEVLQHYDVPAGRVRVVRSGAGYGQPLAPAAPAMSTRTPKDPLVLYVGSIFNRRHLPTLIRAFTKVTRWAPTARLVIVGDDRTYPQEDLASVRRASAAADQITLRSYVSEVELDALYQQARVFVFLSEYEGFGLTPLEAMSASIPTVVGDTPVARELYQDGALFVPVRDIARTAAAVTALLGDESLRTRQVTRAARALAALSWERASEETLDVLESAVG